MQPGKLTDPVPRRDQFVLVIAIPKPPDVAPDAWIPLDRSQPFLPQAGGRLAARESPFKVDKSGLVLDEGCQRATELDPDNVFDGFSDGRRQGFASAGILTAFSPRPEIAVSDANRWAKATPNRGVSP